jgi:glucosamine--fructose-6-phosphate aminotransferase (isomerizing)
MCGIVGYIGDNDAAPFILDGLKKLEYRGYDSAGIAVFSDGKIQVRRNAGKLAKLIESLDQKMLKGKAGIGHTRWATHGVPNDRNAHPVTGSSGKIVVVHNGIVENYLELRDELESEGVIFHTETDTETIVHLMEKNVSLGNDIVTSLRNILKIIKGANAVVVLSSEEPDKIVAARIGNAGGVVVGYGENEMYVASDIPAILEYTSKMSFLESHQIAIVYKDHTRFENIDGNKIELKVQKISWDPVSAAKGNYRHFMQKEIHEQARGLTDTLAGRIDFEKDGISLFQLNLDEEFAKKIDQIKIVACGTASHVGMVGKIMIERITKIPVEVDIASEFRYRDPIILKNTVVLAISQSGETADTLAAMEESRKKGAVLWSIVNAIGSQAMRLADGYISMQVGPEIGVASTKAFTAPLLDLYMLAVLLADHRKVIDAKRKHQLILDLITIPELVSITLDREPQVVKVAEKLKDIKNILYLGRGGNMPIAYEGALKLKEISYIHAEAYPAGEMKHGPIALIDENMPVLAIMPNDPWREKMISQVEQVKARGGKIILVATDGDELASKLGDEVLWIPPAPWLLNPVVSIIPLQLLAYHIASIKGLDVDQPRNLAKSVTVE